ncbi:hypothetical protein PIB30_004104 [Stylosanthes scabra]|uniref:Uncharacterized protein n=1 Tax=Stylosanthes scabra TaxID=79078 RepID=A0ABU6Z4C5_9FABA|nr:hypothetical protein [Stylosanthes scabra]
MVEIFMCTQNWVLANEKQDDDIVGKNDFAKLCEDFSLQNSEDSPPPSLELAPAPANRNAFELDLLFANLKLKRLSLGGEGPMAVHEEPNPVGRRSLANSIGMY